MTENEYRARILESDLSTNAKFVCFILLHHRNRITNKCFPSQETIALSASMCPNTVRRATRELETAKFITITKKRHKNSRYSCNHYDFGLSPSKFEVSNEPSNEPSNPAHKPIEPIYNKNGFRKSVLDFGGDYTAYKKYLSELDI